MSQQTVVKDEDSREKVRGGREEGEVEDQKEEEEGKRQQQRGVGVRWGRVRVTGWCFGSPTRDRKNRYSSLPIGQAMQRHLAAPIQTRDGRTRAGTDPGARRTKKRTKNLPPRRNGLFRTSPV
uniref:Uncharacterized protein n=1 Tax=Cacopsylla melanoneura TaxID=428564 RepID=A0A8D8VH93_9HEMI